MRDYKNKVKKLIIFKPDFLYEVKALSIEATFFIDENCLIYKKSRNLRNWDVDNRVKPLLDAVSAAFGFSDTKFSKVNASKRFSNKAINEFILNYVIIEISIDHEMQILLEESA